jgi:hypothetical protein
MPRWIGASEHEEQLVKIDSKVHYIHNSYWSNEVACSWRNDINSTDFKKDEPISQGKSLECHERINDQVKDEAVSGVVIGGASKIQGPLRDVPQNRDRKSETVKGGLKRCFNEEVEW